MADPESVQSFVDMGFPKERAEKVLRHFRNNMNVAMDYMISTPEENDAATIT